MGNKYNRYSNMVLAMDQGVPLIDNGYLVIDIFNSLLLLSLSLALSTNYRQVYHTNSVFIGSLPASAGASDSVSNELKMSNTGELANIHFV